MAGYLGGKWVKGSDGGEIEVLNPATGDSLATLASFGQAQTVLAIESADTVLPSAATIDRRSRWLTAIHSAMMKEQNELARIITLEHGKPLKESLAEVEYAAGFFRFFSQQLQALAPHELP